MNRNIERARQNENQALQAIGFVGWLTVTQVAAWVYPESNQHSAKNSAARILTRLTSRGLLMRRQTVLGTWCYLLTNSGAQTVNANFGHDVCRNGYSLSQLNTHKQAQIVAYLLTQEGIRLGPAGVRGGSRCSFVQAAGMEEADALTWSPDLCDWIAALVVRSRHPQLLAKARRLRANAGRLDLIGDAGSVERFEREISAPANMGGWPR